MQPAVIGEVPPATSGRVTHGCEPRRCTHAALRIHWQVTLDGSHGDSVLHAPTPTVHSAEPNCENGLRLFVPGGLL